MLDLKEIRSKFPILSRTVADGKPLIYLDNTATSQTPHSVVEAIVSGYEHSKANVHRGVHTLSQEATDHQESTRRRVAEFIGAPSPQEVVFTRGTTEAINLVASSMGQLLPEGSTVILTIMEHHANIVPWQLLAQRKNLSIKVVNINDRGELDLDQYRNLLAEKGVSMVAFTHASNVLGTVNPVKEMTRMAHERGVPVLVDGAQGVPHIKVDVKDLDVDFYAFSAHKMYGPTGVGILYGKKEWLEKMPPYQGGGEMIGHVRLPQGTTYAELPYKFEAGTPDFVGIAALSATLDFIDSIGMEQIADHEHELLRYCTSRLTSEIEGLRIYGTAPDKDPVISFLIRDIHPYDIGLLLDRLGVAVRTGHHCAQPLMERLSIPGTIRAGFAVYNTRSEVDAFIDALARIVRMF